jgi:hypothetical protein
MKLAITQMYYMALIPNFTQISQQMWEIPVQIHSRPCRKYGCHWADCDEIHAYLATSPWPRGLRRGCAAARLLGLRVRMPPEAWMSVSCECCVSSGRDVCDGIITRPEEPYQVWCVWVWSWRLDNEKALAHWGLLRNGKINYTEFRENPTRCLVVDNRSRTDGRTDKRCLHIRRFFLRTECPQSRPIFKFTLAVNIFHFTVPWICYCGASSCTVFNLSSFFHTVMKRHTGFWY